MSTMVRQSRSQQIQAVVLRSFPYSETSLITHLYARDQGHIAGIARGARQPKSRIGGRLEPFFHLDLTLHVGRSELYTITSVSTLAPYSRLRLHRAGIQHASYACQAVDKLFRSGEPHPEIYYLLVNFLHLLDSDPPVHANMLVQLGFRLKLLVGAGLTPELQRCVRCGIKQQRWEFFSAQLGGVLCSACLKAGDNAKQITSESLDTMRFMIGTPMKSLTETLSERSYSSTEIQTIIHAIVAQHMHIELPTANL